jgi:hypothetical protein
MNADAEFRAAASQAFADSADRLHAQSMQQQLTRLVPAGLNRSRGTAGTLARAGWRLARGTDSFPHWRPNPSAPAKLMTPH